MPPSSNIGTNSWELIILVLAIALPVASVGAAGAVVLIVRRRRQDPGKMPPKKVVASKKLSKDKAWLLRSLACTLALMNAIKKV
ncbi:MAG: hypothetical protein EAX96_21075 [Candidatus Lokiarchaeota archaeon]|nr:hypothetical protein [Candidatus Lokiarchaeota archaeon]